MYPNTIQCLDREIGFDSVRNISNDILSNSTSVNSTFENSFPRENADLCPTKDISKVHGVVLTLCQVWPIRVGHSFPAPGPSKAPGIVSLA